MFRGVNFETNGQKFLKNWDKNFGQIHKSPVPDIKYGIWMKIHLERILEKRRLLIYGLS